MTHDLQYHVITFTMNSVHPEKRIDECPQYGMVESSSSPALPTAESKAQEALPEGALRRGGEIVDTGVQRGGQRDRTAAEEAHMKFHGGQGDESGDEWESQRRRAKGNSLYRAPYILDSWAPFKGNALCARPPSPNH